MNARTILTSLLLILFAALPAFAQEDCSSIFKVELENLSGIKAAVQNQSGFLAILDTDSKTKAIKIVSLIKSLRKENTINQCDFSGVAVAVVDSNLDQVKSGTSAALSNNDVTKLLYEYVYKLSPIEVEENLRGYEKLSELSPQNSYYAARKEHYKKRIDLIKDRNKFIASCLKEVRNNKRIADLKVKKDFYLFVANTDTPLKTAEAFLKKVSETTSKPDKKICIIAYSKDLGVKETSCPAEYKDNLLGNEEELLMRHVQSLPSYQIQKNINGYAALKKLNQSSTLYTSKLDSYESKQQGLDKFLGLSVASGQGIFTKNSAKGSTLFASVNRDVLSGKSKSANQKLFKTLTTYYQHTGRAYPKCVLKNAAGKTLGTITCNRNGCSFR